MIVYFKNVELAEKYRISEATVRNWIKMSKDGKLNLSLVDVKGRTYVTNSPGNIALINSMVSTNRKYRNTKAECRVSVGPEFYRIFEKRYMYDIIRNLELKREIPRQYNYFADGADRWDVYATEQYHDMQPSMTKATTVLLSECKDFLDRRLAHFDYLNVIDMGMGNVLPAKELLSSLYASKKLARYIAVDLSPRMLDIAERNVKEWFGDSFPFEAYRRDISCERFPEIVMNEYLLRGSIRPRTGNLFLLLGDTPTNFAVPNDAFRTICESMQPGDFLISTGKIETQDMQPEWYIHDYPSTPRHFTLTPRHRYVFDLLGISPSYYQAEIGYDKELGYRYVRARLKIAITLKFEFEDGERTVHLEKGDTILLWRSWQVTAHDFVAQFDHSGFYVLHSSQTEDHAYIITVAEVKRD
ncbi:MAG TPA: L-histidine N(alpha)-methyltransferase [Patescibacteria group bacterium]|nr:L-histidine N(alpha)-methyltransferase [Patescibacteria group bacterium]